MSLNDNISSTTHDGYSNPNTTNSSNQQNTRDLYRDLPIEVNTNSVADIRISSITNTSINSNTSVTMVSLHNDLFDLRNETKNGFDRLETAMTGITSHILIINTNKKDVYRIFIISF